VLARQAFCLLSHTFIPLVINLVKKGNDIYNENFKALMKKIEEKFPKVEGIPCSWIGRINITKIYQLPKVIYRFKTIPTKISITFFKELQKNHKVHMETKTQIIKAILS
jgi:hypothetical protein